MRVSLQRLGDNPRDHDGVFVGFKEDVGCVPGTRPDATEAAIKPSNENTFERWKIYPSPPPPHWKWKPQGESVAPDSAHSNEDVRVEEFDFAKCDITGHHEWEFSLDEMGVYQVYGSEQGAFGISACF